MLGRGRLARTLHKLALDISHPASGKLMGQTECLTRARPRPNSFDGCRLATLAAQQDGCKERVRGQQVPRLQLEEAQASLRDTPDRPFVLKGAMEGWAARSWDLDELKRRYGERGSVM